MKPLKNIAFHVNRIGIPCVAVYVYSMLIHPWIVSGFSWRHVHAVWDNWQTFNAALLAFFASWIALNIARARDERQRQRDSHQQAREYFATSALLPAAFSDLNAYFKASAAVLNHLWEEVEPKPKAPEPASFYRGIFQNCIRHADANIARYLKQILVDLQIHEARLDSITSSGVVADRHSLIVYAYALAKLKVAVDKQYSFARDEKDFDESSPVWDDFKSAYSILNIDRDDYVVAEFNLTEFTVKRIGKLSHG